MCYHISNQDRQALRTFKLPVKKIESFKEMYDMNGYDKPAVPVISVEAPRTIDMYNWGFTYGKKIILNARNDELFNPDKQWHRYYKNRCLVICTGYFEPHYPENGGNYQSWYIKPTKSKCFVLGAIYRYQNGLPQVSIVTKDATPLLARVHNDGMRQPLMLDGDAAWAWVIPDLTKDEMADLTVYPYPEDKMTAYRVPDGVFSNNIETNIPEIIEPYIPGLAPLPLFGNQNDGDDDDIPVYDL